MLHRTPSTSDGWLGRLQLEFSANASGRTELRRARHEGPLRIQRVFPQPSGACHAYLLHPPGGVVGGDRLTLDVTTRTGARTLVTSPGATKFYRSAGPWGEQHVSLRIERGSQLEWLPLENIAFEGTRTRTQTRIDVEAGGRLVWWDITCLGRPACDERFERGILQQRVELRVDGRPLWIERARYGPDTLLQASRCGLQHEPVVGTLLAYPAQSAWLEPLRSLTEQRNDTYRMGATVVRETFVCRAIGRHSDVIRQQLQEVWRGLRRLDPTSDPDPPRVWST